jgi:hypothetical protein
MSTQNSIKMAFISILLDLIVTVNQGKYFTTFFLL